MGGIRHKLRLLFVGGPYAFEQSVQRGLNALQILVMHVDPVFHGIHFEVGDRVLQVVVLCLVKRHLAELLRLAAIWFRGRSCLRTCPVPETASVMRSSP